MQHERAKMALAHRPADMYPQPPSHGRVLWNNSMVTCLLELRLGLLLPRFVGGSSSQLKDAWNALQLKFVLVTNVNLSVQQLKNKYQQLKREYAFTKIQLAKRSRLEQKQAAAAEAREGDGESNEHDEEEEDADNDEEDENQGEIVLPGYWDIVDKAFSGAEGYDGVELRNRGSSSSTIKRHKKRDRDYLYNREAAAATEEDGEDDDSDDASSHAESARHQSRAGDDEGAPSDSSVPPAQRQPRNIPPDTARPALPIRQAPHPQSALHEFYRRLVPTGPPPPPPAYANNNMQFTPPPQAAPAPPYAYNHNAQYQHQQPMMNSRSPFSDPNTSAKKRKIDMSYAIVSVGESIANAVVESARIMAGRARSPSPYPFNGPVEGQRGEAGHPTGAVASAAAGAPEDLAAKMDTQIQNQVLMLKMLEKSNQVNEELLQLLRKSNKSTSSDNEQSE